MSVKDDNYYDNLQYNSCISKGICSVNPRTSALQNVLSLYLHLCAKYCLKLYDKNTLKSEIKDFILNMITISVSNPEFTENCFMESIDKLKEILPEIIKTYNALYDKNDFEGEDILSSDIFKKCENIIDAIKFGEYIFKTHVLNIDVQIRDMFKIMLIIAKSLSINLLDLESYNSKTENKCYFYNILNLLNALNPKNANIDKLKNLIYEASASNTKIMELLHQEQENRYGRQCPVKISYTTKPSKAVLVVGSNIRELETILENLKNTDIDVYTHDDMMVAHTFPKFGEYKNLKGQYGHGVENCLIDFATFPGPIILTKHSLHNIENLYRGRLFTTDFNVYKGIIKIESNDYSEVVESANSAKGFKKGKTCETVDIGYDYFDAIKTIESKIKSGKYKKVVVIGLQNYSSGHKDYFEKLIKHISDNILIISFSYSSQRNNFLHYNACFDSYAVVNVVSQLLKYDVLLDVFLPKCGRNTVAEMIHFSKYKNNTVYMGECEPIMINPSMKNTLTNIFNIKVIDSAKKDSTLINKLSKD